MNNKKVLIGLAFSGMIMAGGVFGEEQAKHAGHEGSSTKHMGHSKSSHMKMAKMMGECHGINSCKGTGACGGKGHSCAGKNSCKGKGWLKMTKKTCLAKNGTFKKSNMSM